MSFLTLSLCLLVSLMFLWKIWKGSPPSALNGMTKLQLHVTVKQPQMMQNQD